MFITFLKPSTQRILIPFLFVYAALHGAWTVLHWGGPEVVDIIASSLFVLPCLFPTALAFWRAQNESQPSVRRGWELLGFALSFLGLGSFILAYYIVSGAAIPFPSLADPFLLVFPWIFFASLMALTHDQLSKLERYRVLLNTIVTVGAIGLIEWALLLRNTVAVDASTPFASVVALLYPLGDLVMVGGLLYSTLLVLGRVRLLYLLPMIGGAAFFVLGNLIYAIEISAGTHQVGSPLDVTWTLGLVLFSIAALLPNRPATAAEGVQNLPSWLKRVPGIITGGLLLSALAALVWLVVSSQTRPEDGVIVFLALALIGVASSLRQRLELHENALLNRELQAVNASLEARVKSAVGTLERRNLELVVQTQEIRHSNEESQQRTHEVTLLNELGELLQMCVSFEEASAVISRMGPHFFPGASGALYLTSASRNVVERAASWGGGGDAEVFAPEDCWALRRGRDHLVTADGTAGTPLHPSARRRVRSVPVYTADSAG